MNQNELVERYKNHTFYSTVSKRLFLIPDYYTNGSGILENLIQNLQSVTNYFASEFSISNNIYAKEIVRSKWCLNMWLFQTPFENAENLPDFVKVIDIDMWDFIK